MTKKLTFKKLTEIGTNETFTKLENHQYFLKLFYLSSQLKVAC